MAHVSESLLSGPFTLPDAFCVRTNLAQIAQIVDYCNVLGLLPNSGLIVSNTTKSVISQMFLLYVISLFGIIGSLAFFCALAQIDFEGNHILVMFLCVFL